MSSVNQRCVIEQSRQRSHSCFPVAIRDSNGKDHFLLSCLHGEEGIEHNCSELSFPDPGITATELGDHV